MTEVESPMRLGVFVNYNDDFLARVPEIVEYERVGVDLVTVAEAYSFDAVSRLGYLAAVTKRVALASSILSIYSRTPSLLATTAAGIDLASNGRFELGIGASGPQVVEGFHGVSFDAPLGRTREIIEICRAIWRQDQSGYSGKFYTIEPAEDQDGDALKPGSSPYLRSAIPVAVAALTPTSVKQVAEIADAWMPTLYYPEKAGEVWNDALESGTARRTDSLDKLKVEIGVPLAIGDNTDEALDAFRQQVALYVGGMGAKGKNFYHAVATSYGYGTAADTVQDLFLSGRPQEAKEAVPEDLARAMSLIGSEAQVRERIQAFAAAGVTSLSVQLFARSATERLEAVEAVRGLL